MSASNPIDLTQSIGTAPGAIPADAEQEPRSWLDRIGITASLLCAIHCIAAPFLLLLLPAAGSIWAHPAVHWVLAVLVVPLALWVLFKGYTKHGNKLTLVAATVGALLILAGLISPMIHSEPVVEFTVPTLFGDAGASATTPLASAVPAGTAPACTDACCPTITQGENGSIIAMPPGGLLTLLGSVLLVLAHTSNLIACRCFSKTPCGDAACGCPA
ncbi:MAG: MerC domain-containing protein [Phycisphaeraceae bacterium]|nr:MerC domain-containing protein [Phycisphaeraceae bacterium]